METRQQKWEYQWQYSNELEFAYDFTLTTRCDGLISIEIDVLRNKPHSTITKQELTTACVITAKPLIVE